MEKVYNHDGPCPVCGAPSPLVHMITDFDRQTVIGYRMPCGDLLSHKYWELKVELRGGGATAVRFVNREVEQRSTVACPLCRRPTCLDGSGRMERHKGQETAARVADGNKICEGYGLTIDQARKRHDQQRAETAELRMRAHP